MSRFAVIGFIVALLCAACGASSGPAASSAADPSKDKLAQVMARGTLVLWTDPDYAPQSFAVKGAVRAATTKCQPNQMTAPEVSGYDAETGKLVAAAMGVEPCFVTSGFDKVIAGSWGDHGEVAFASGALETGRMKNLYMTQPYYTTPASFFVATSSSYQAPADLSGKRIGACAGCTHQQYLQGTLQLPGEKVTYAVTNPQIVTYASEPPGLAAVAAGKLDAFLCSEPVGVAAINTGLALRKLSAPAFTTFKTGYIDRGMSLSPVAFVDRINTIVASLHPSGKLKALSIQFFGTDYATAAAAFDLTSIGQRVP